MDFTEHTIASEQIVDGVLIKAYRDRVVLPNGRESVREWVDHPGAAAVVPIFEDGKLLLVRQYRYACRRHFLEVPAGKLEAPDDDPADVALRELEEETGYRAAHIEPLGKPYVCVGYSNERIHFFEAKGLERTEAAPEEDEFLEPVCVALDRAIEMIVTGEIDDMKSVAAILLAAKNRMRI